METTSPEFDLTCSPLLHQQVGIHIPDPRTHPFLLWPLPRRSAVAGKTPYEAFYGRKPSAAHLRVFGCRAYVHVAKDKRRLFQPKSLACIFLGYPLDYKGWKCWDPVTNKVVISRDVRFVESKMPGAELKLRRSSSFSAAS